MNKSNPLLPQGSLLEQQSKGRRRFQLWVFCGIALHLVFLGGLLMLGCDNKKDDGTAAKTPGSGLTGLGSETATPPLTLPAATDTSAPPAMASAPPLPIPATTSAPVVTPPAPIPTSTPAITEPPATPTAAKEYKVAKGDSYYTVGKKFGVSTKAMEKANPTIPATKLKVGMTIQIPAATPAATPTTKPEGIAAPGTPAATDSGEVYTVKSGDNLTKIATAHHTSAKAIRALNGLKTDRLKVGDKLKVPAKSGGTVAATETPAPPTIPASTPVSGVPVPPPSVVR